ncbi:nucleotide exchange factor GrpE [Syntrophotalea acetylenivorans]|uniref:Protein GrpE n=1 Tax=Syntrophotalea acetylenivorans TaxID=1842532 RepID=A0A1L3GQQ5_9BACT|nr:nucleotide exchange factor GrpE [Syntrophotalea acetylenivorans]APG28243.1 nucleotide exchange factor GrpE [Syntrophotalea acetylenivorans]
MPQKKKQEQDKAAAVNQVPQEEEASVAEKSEPSAEEVLAESQAEAQKNWDLYLRERAELENYRKRMQREKEDLARFANENLLRDMLPILDNLERAVDHAEQDQEGGLLEGVQMTLDQFRKTLERLGVVPVAAIGETFSPDCHEAMGQLESAEHAPNTVVQEMQKGYTLNDRLLRPALVMIAKAPADSSKD